MIYKVFLLPCILILNLFIQFNKHCICSWEHSIIQNLQINLGYVLCYIVSFNQETLKCFTLNNILLILFMKDGDPMDCSTQGFPVLHYLPEFAETHVYWVSDAIQQRMSYPLLPPAPLALNLSQHQGPFQWVNSLHQVTKVLLFLSL